MRSTQIMNISILLFLSKQTTKQTLFQLFFYKILCGNKKN